MRSWDRVERILGRKAEWRDYIDTFCAYSEELSLQVYSLSW